VTGIELTTRKLPGALQAAQEVTVVGEKDSHGLSPGGA